MVRKWKRLWRVYRSLCHQNQFTYRLADIRYVVSFVREKVAGSDSLEQESGALEVRNMGYTNYCICWIKILIFEIFSEAEVFKK